MNGRKVNYSVTSAIKRFLVENVVQLSQSGCLTGVNCTRLCIQHLEDKGFDVHNLTQQYVKQKVKECVDESEILQQHCIRRGRSRTRSVDRSTENYNQSNDISTNSKGLPWNDVTNDVLKNYLNENARLLKQLGGLLSTKSVQRCIYYLEQHQYIPKGATDAAMRYRMTKIINSSDELYNYLSARGRSRSRSVSVNRIEPLKGLRSVDQQQDNSVNNSNLQCNAHKNTSVPRPSIKFENRRQDRSDHTDLTNDDSIRKATDRNKDNIKHKQNIMSNSYEKKSTNNKHERLRSSNIWTDSEASVAAALNLPIEFIDNQDNLSSAVRKHWRLVDEKIAMIREIENKLKEKVDDFSKVLKGELEI